jgi:hypothetical protein
LNVVTATENERNAQIAIPKRTLYLIGSGEKRNLNIARE